jgi:hypothetical protein
MPAMRGVAVRDVFEEDTTSGSGERLTPTGPFFITLEIAI